MTPTSLDEIFQQLGVAFSGTGAGGGTLAVDLAITDEEAAAGVTREIACTRAERCDACEGRGGATPEARPVACPDCKGAGGTEAQQGFFVVKTVCARCQGRKTVFARPCASCRGDGLVQAATTVVVKVPAGTTHGSTLRIANAGALVRGTDDAPGDLLVFVLVGDRTDPRAIAVPAAPASAEDALPRAQVYGGGAATATSRIGYAIAIALLITLVAVALLR